MAHAFGQVLKQAMQTYSSNVSTHSEIEAIAVSQRAQPLLVAFWVFLGKDYSMSAVQDTVGLFCAWQGCDTSFLPVSGTSHVHVATSCEKHTNSQNCEAHKTCMPCVQ